MISTGRAQKLGKPIAIAAIVCRPLPTLDDPCAPAAETGESVTISDTRLDNHLALVDGRIVQLTGLDLASLAFHPSAPLPLAGKEATLVEADAPDRHGAVHDIVYMESEDLSFALLTLGKARTRPAIGEDVCYAELITAVDNARRARLGLWTDPGYAVADAASRKPCPATLMLLPSWQDRFSTLE
jgi:hypothetical protein